MSPDKQRIAIAQACGWKYIINDPERYPYWSAPKGDLRYGNPLDAELFPKAFPDYLNDLNAMHEAEKMLTQAQDYHYRASILPAVCNDGSGMIAMTALAAQRAEALLRTIGKWEGVK
jgi:hypothetical protein